MILKRDSKTIKTTGVYFACLFLLLSRAACTSQPESPSMVDDVKKTEQLLLTAMSSRGEEYLEKRKAAMAKIVKEKMSEKDREPSCT